MTAPIPPKRFYPTTNFLPPSQRPSKARRKALSAARNDPSRHYRIFPQQQLAFDYSDSHPSLRLHVWALEKNAHGKRQYIAASYNAFWHMYKRFLLRSLDMHFYEVIRENHACRLYFDLEYLQKWNTDKNANQMVQTLIDMVAQVSGKNIRRDSVVELDSTSERKFSRHVIFRQVLFCDNEQMGCFVRDVVERIIENDENMMMVKKGEACEKVPYVDLGVYTKNRCFRLIASSKFGKKQRLLPLGEKQEDRIAISSQQFMDALVCCVSADEELMGIRSAKEMKNGRNLLASSSNGQRFAGEVDVAVNSDLPKLDAYVMSIICKDGGGIYRVTKFAESGHVMYAIKGGYKWCGNIGRHHKSNNVILVADVTRAKMFQKCFDPDCRGYRSNEWDIPGDILGGISNDGYIDVGLSDESLLEMMTTLEEDWEEGIGDDEMVSMIEEFEVGSSIQ